jgi:anti-anti-sigma factor
MRLSECRIGEVATLTLSGRVGGWKAASIIDDSFRRQARSKDVRTVILDLGDVPAIDSVGLDAIIRGCQLLGYASAEMRIAGLSRRLGDLIVITRLAMLCETFATVADAIQGAVPAATTLVEAPQRATVYTVHA